MLILAAAAMLEKFTAAEKRNGAPVQGPSGSQQQEGPPCSQLMAGVACCSSPQTHVEMCLPARNYMGWKTVLCLFQAMA